MKLIHLTDPHLCKPGRKIYGLNPLDRLQAAIASINQDHADADLCIITGDLAHTAEPEAYEALARCLDTLAIPCRLVMGNHDSRVLLLDRFSGLGVDDNGFVQYRVQTPAGGFYVLDSVQPGTHQGAYCQARRAWLREQLNAYPDQDAFLFMHHPPFKVGIAAMDNIGIRQDDADALGALLDEYDNVRHLFFGHLHRPLSGSWKGIGFSTLRATNHQVWLDFRSGDIIAGSHEPPAYAIVLIDRDQLVVHTHDFLDASPKFDLGSWKWEEWNKVDPEKALL
ncbi:phosphodiesterase [Thiosocius teredinicola]|uniref:phosphodiesterase n=1 Tax=Thiosocius teredinicola TaxID=1973002 RepID=UPI000990EA4C